MGDKVKVQDIADRVGLSRNTVSKIFNGKYKGNEDIRSKVLQLAIDMNYKEYGQLTQSAKMSTEELKVPVRNKNIVVFSKGDIIQSNFFAHIVNEIQKKTEGEGYTVLLVNVTQNDVDALHIPVAVNEEQVDGMICMELFHKEYIEKLLAKNIPTVFVEFYYNAWEISGCYDIVMMENSHHVYQMTSALIKGGCKRIGFAGDYKHCLGFYERYRGYSDAMRDKGLSSHTKESFLMEDGALYFNEEWLSTQLLSEKIVPDAYVCANDAIAINLIVALNRTGFRVPEDVQIISFDDIQEAVLMKPPLTTVRIFREDLGKSATDCLLERMRCPEKRKQIIYVETKPVLRKSTLPGFLKREG